MKASTSSGQLRMSAAPQLERRYFSNADGSVIVQITKCCGCVIIASSLKLYIACSLSLRSIVHKIMSALAGLPSADCRWSMKAAAS